MKTIAKGDIVGRKSYNCDIYFKVIDIFDDKGATCARLKGLDLRLFATSPLHDLEKIEPASVATYWHDVMSKIGRASCRERV